MQADPANRPGQEPQIGEHTMSPVRTGAQRIWSGDPKVMRKAPPPRPTRRARQEEPEEITFLAEAKKLEKAKREAEPTGLTRAVQRIKDSGVEGAEAGYQLNKALNAIYGDEIKRVRTTAHQEARLEYFKQAMQPEKPSFEEMQELQAEYTGAAQTAAEKFTKQIISTLPPALRTWYNKQVADYQSLMAKCQAKYKAELEKVKDKYGDDPRKYTNERLKLQAKIFPDWSSKGRQAEEELTERHDTLAKAITAAKATGATGLDYEELYTMATSTKESAKKQAKKKGVTDKQLAAIRGEKYVEPEQPAVSITAETVQRPIETIKATPEEQAKASKAEAEAKARGWSCYPQLNTYKVTRTDGTLVLVEAFDKGTAENKAEKAGHDVAWVTKKMSWETPGPQREETGRYEVNLKDGTKILMEPTKDPKTGEATWAIPALEKYRDNQGNYELLHILEDKPISESAIAHVFGENVVKWGTEATTALSKLEPYKEADGYRLTQALAEGAITKEQAEAVFPEEAIRKAAGQVALAKAAPTGEDKVEALISGRRTPTQAEIKAGKALTYKGLGLVAADLLVPFVYVARHWDDISPAERAAWISADIAFFVAPLARAGVAGARGAVAAGRAARLAGAAGGVGRGMVAMVKGPATTVMHPVATTKQALKDVRSLVTNIAHPRKIPEAVLTTTEGTVRLKLAGGTSLDEYMRARDKLIALAAKGERPFVQLRDTSGKVIANLELTKAPLMREVKGGITHTTPWGGRYQDALTVRLKPGMPASEQGLFVTHEPLPRFARQSAFNMPIEVGQAARPAQTVTTKIGYNQVVRLNLSRELPAATLQKLRQARLIETPGQELTPLNMRRVRQLASSLRSAGSPQAAKGLQETAEAYKPVFRIISPDKVDELVGTGKAYRGTVEMEGKLPVGTKVEPPKQVLFTYIGPEATRVEIWLDKPLSAKQIARLKAEGLAEVFRQPFRTPLKVTPVKGSGLTKAQAKELANIIDAAGNAKVARRLERAYDLARSQARLGRTMARAGVRSTPTLRAAATPVARAEIRRAPRKEIEYISRARQLEREARGAPPGREGRADRTGRAGRTERPTRRERAERPERIERPERVERAEEPTKPLRPMRLARGMERPSRPSRAKAALDFPGLGSDRLIGPPDSLVSWRQGMYYITVMDPYRTTGTKPDVLYSRERPPWAKKVKGRRSPQRTLKAIGRVPRNLRVPMGVVSARVKNGRKLRFLPA